MSLVKIHRKYPNSGHNLGILIVLNKFVLPVGVYYVDFIMKQPCAVKHISVNFQLFIKKLHEGVSMLS